MVAVLILFAAVLYFFPMFVAIRREHPQAAPISVINIFLGWSLIGWVVAFAWAVSGDDPPSRTRRPLLGDSSREGRPKPGRFDEDWLDRLS